MSVKLWRSFFATIILAYTLCSLSWGQSIAANARIQITVTDPQHAVIAGAKVVLRNTDVGLVRSASSDPEGKSIFSGLPPGTYALEVQAAGFTTKKIARINASVGNTIDLTVSMEVAAASEAITVTGRGAAVEGNTAQPAVNKREAQTGNYMAGLTVTYLPSRDRDLTQLAQLAAGVTPDADAFGVVIAGQRATATQIAVDGADFNDPLWGGQRGGRDGSMFFPQTVVREFQLVRAGAGADVGGTNAGFINIATKEGTNKLRGEFFYLGRPPALTSDDAFGNSLGSSVNEFGGSLGGPIRRNKAFFYIGGEQDFLHVPYQTQFAQQSPGTIIPASLSSLEQPNLQKSSPTALFGRTDWILGRANTLNLQVNYNRIHSTAVDGGSTRSLAAPGHSDSWTGYSVWVRGSLNTIFGTNVNQLLAQWARDRRDITPDSSSPEIFINGFGILGGNSLAPNHYVSQRREINDDIEFSRHGSLLHFGAKFADDPVRQQQEPNLNGRFDFSSLADFLSGQLRRFRQTFATGDTVFSGSVRHLGLYASSSLPLSKILTVTAGLRWDAQWNPQPNQPNAAIPQTASIPDDLTQWQPRVGIAWSPRPSTVVRISSGLYDAPTPATIFQRVFTDNGVNTASIDSFYDPLLLRLPGVTSLQALTALPLGLAVHQAEVIGISPAFRNPRSFQVSGTVEQEIGKKTTVSLGYLRNSTWDLQQRLDRNLLSPTITATGLPVFPNSRPVSTLGRLLVNESGAHSSYDGLLLTGTFQLSRRSQLTANYTLSRTRDDDASLGPFAPDLTLNPFNPSAERAYSSLDARHSFNVNAVVNLFWGLKINPVLVARSGLPYTPVIGFDGNNDANDSNDRALIGSSIAARNLLRQPAFFNLDLRFVKDFTLKGEGHHLDLFLDIFNITGADNRNFGPDSLSLFGPPSSLFFSANQPLFAPNVTRFGSARQVQFTARLVAF